MTRSITPITAASNGGDPASNENTPIEHGLSALRDIEGRGLISLVCDALSETHSLAYEMHAQLYAHDPADDRDLRQLNDEALSCLQTAEHYLLMLGSVVDERIPPDPDPDPDPEIDPWSVQPTF
jgi:hypothetical protein